MSLIFKNCKLGGGTCQQSTSVIAYNFICWLSLKRYPLYPLCVLSSPLHIQVVHYKRVGKIHMNCMNILLTIFINGHREGTRDNTQETKITMYI